MKQKILITGASGGFGKLTVKSLLENGHEVVASLRDANGRNKTVANDLQNLGAKIVEIDVTNDESVNFGVAKAIQLLNGLDVVINNAGLGVLGIQEFYTSEDFQKLFDINVFGVQRVNRATIPHFRKQNKGLIIYTSSLLGRLAMPFYGPYQASKWALEALASNYRVELSTFGIENCIVEPGGYPTTFIDNLMNPSDKSEEVNYGDFAHFPKGMLDNFENVLHNNPQQNPQRVADAFVDLINIPYGEKPFRTEVDFIGMGDLVNKYNNHLEEIETGLYTNFGIAHLRSVSKEK
jgi:NAD(P)-dependent dehydrogenase (short-subunit alcohol dehydrogenase family)